MSAYSKINVIYRLQKWMDSVPGQTFLNYAYSWGAAVVILGTLFKLTHLPGANLMLFIGMGTEVVVFFLSAFDRPFDKTADGMEIPTHVTEEYLNSNPQPVAAEQPQPVVAQQSVSAPVSPVANGQQTTVQQPTATVAPQPTAAPQQPVVVPQQPVVIPQMAPAPEVEEAQNSYVEEMENLNRTLTGISRVYEMQLKSASQQMGTIDQINEQHKKMAEQIEQLNKIYTRMIEAMTERVKG